MTAQRVLVWLLSLFVLAVIGARVSGAGAASLPALPDAIYQGYSPIPPISGTPPELTGPGTYSQTYQDPINVLDSGQVSITLLGAPSPFASAGVDSSISTFTASGHLFYYFEIVGGAGANPVKLNLTASLSATSYGDGNGGASMQIQQVSGVSFVNNSGGTACSNGAPCGVLGADWAVCSVAASSAFCSGEPDSIVLPSTPLSLFSNTVYLVELAASAGAPDPLVPYSVTGGGKGVVDPQLTIDPSNTAGYSLDFSPGIGNSSTPVVPEPSTWILFSVGFAGVAWLFFSRKGSRAALTTSL